MRKVCILSSVHIALDNRVFYREAQSLRRAGFDVTLIAIHPQDEEKDGVRILALPHVPRWQRPRTWLTLMRRAIESRADVYHFHDPELLLVTPWLRWFTGKPTIYDVHEVYADFFKVKDYLPAWIRYPAAWTFRWAEPLLARFQSALIFSDEAIPETFRRVSRPRATLFNYPARAFIDQAARETAASPQRPPVVLHLGGHERNRGTALMIEAFDQILEELPEARLVLVGHFIPPELEQEVRADIDRRSIAHAVTIAGRVPFETIGRYLAEAAVGWVPWQAVEKNKKNVPTKLFEYMAYGVPIVSSDLPSVAPYVHENQNGLRVKPDDPVAHGEAILKLLRDPASARLMGLHGRSLVESRYNWDAMEERLVGLYQELLS